MPTTHELACLNSSTLVVVLAATLGNNVLVYGGEVGTER